MGLEWNGNGRIGERCALWEEEEEEEEDERGRVDARVMRGGCDCGEYVREQAGGGGRDGEGRGGWREGLCVGLGGVL